MSDNEDDYDYDDNQQLIGKTHYEGLNFDTFLEKGKHSELSFEEKFELSLEKNILYLDFEDGKQLIPYVMRDIKDVTHMRFKNPLAFLFGYYVINEKKIDESRIKACIDMCKKTLSSVTLKSKDDKTLIDKKYSHIKHITEADIIRYARLIISST